MSNVRTGTFGSRTVTGGGQGPLVRIGELARRAGIPAATLRAWERRYGVVSPTRGESGYRLYSADDERRVREMVRLIEGGLAPAEAAMRVKGASVTEAPAIPAGSAPAVASPLLENSRHELLEALSAFDAEEADRQLDRAAASLSMEAFLSQLVLPVLREIGERWASGDAEVSEEHFASSLIRGRLLGMARGWGGGSGDLALLACPPGERHDLGVICFGLVLRSHGWRVAFLGADTPPEAIQVAVDRTSPALVVLFAIEAQSFEQMEDPLHEIAASSRLRIAGPGAEATLCIRVGAELLAGDPVDAANAVLV